MAYLESLSGGFLKQLAAVSQNSRTTLYARILFALLSTL